MVAARPSRLIRARILLLGVEPEVWRLVEIDGDLTLDQVHRAIQVAMGWQDCHLHCFTERHRHKRNSDEGMGPPRDWIMDLEIAEGRPGLPETDAKLGDVLSESSPTLFYEYDYGDGWTHRIEFLELIEDDPKAPPALLVRGQGSCPPEDCGGTHGFGDLLKAHRNPAGHGEYMFDLTATELLAWADYRVGPWRNFDPDFLDVEAVNQELRDLFPADRGLSSPPTVLDHLLDSIPLSMHMEFRSWIGWDPADELPSIDAEEAGRMVRPYTWLLDRIGEDGMKLTAAGYMPPKVVNDLMHELDWADDWLGKLNREDQTPAAMDLRESAARLGLIRKYKGHLKRTRLAESAFEDPIELLRLIAGRLPSCYHDEALNLTSWLLLASLAGEGVRGLDDLSKAIGETLGMTGFADRAGDPPDVRDVRYGLAEPRRDLERLGVFRNPDRRAARDDDGDFRPTEAGRTFARLALVSTGSVGI